MHHFDRCLYPKLLLFITHVGVSPGAFPAEAVCGTQGRGWIPVFCLEGSDVTVSHDTNTPPPPRRLANMAVCSLKIPNQQLLFFSELSKRCSGTWHPGFDSLHMMEGDLKCKLNYIIHNTFWIQITYIIYSGHNGV